jgi:hypothetical protein
MKRMAAYTQLAWRSQGDRLIRTLINVFPIWVWKCNCKNKEQSRKKHPSS